VIINALEELKHPSDFPLVVIGSQMVLENIAKKIGVKSEIESIESLEDIE
jgi:hypothetical protein